MVDKRQIVTLGLTVATLAVRPSASTAVEGSTTREVFEVYFERVLAPSLRPGQLALKATVLPQPCVSLLRPAKLILVDPKSPQTICYRRINDDA